MQHEKGEFLECMIGFVLFIASGGLSYLSACVILNFVYDFKLFNVY